MQAHLARPPRHICIFWFHCISWRLMLVFSPLFTASCKQNKPLADADVHSRWMGRAVKVLEGEQCRGGGLHCSRCLLSDVNPVDWYDRKLLDFRGKQSSNPGFTKKKKEKSSQTCGSSELRSDVNIWTGWRGPDGDPVDCLPEPPPPPWRFLYERGANGRRLGELPPFTTKHFSFCFFSGEKKAIRSFAGKQSAGTWLVGY